MKTQAQAQDGQIQAEGGDKADYVDSDRVIAADAGKEAFNGMIDAVNSADERVKGFTGELEKAIEQAVWAKKVFSDLKKCVNVIYNILPMHFRNQHQLDTDCEQDDQEYLVDINFILWLSTWWQ